MHPSTRQRRHADEVRSLASEGTLAATVARASDPQRAALTSGTYEIAWPIVFSGLTQRIERRRGHYRCATSVCHLADECLDRFEDDVEAVVHDVIHSARRPISNIEAWIASRLNAATVDGYRRRRGQIGAQQRPRVPKWLAIALGNDRWLMRLATEMLVWVGNPTTAGMQLWPTEGWTALRCEVRGDWTADNDIDRDIAIVLAAMRGKPAWYNAYVERPMGNKRAPLLRRVDSDTSGTDSSSLALVDRAEIDDAYLRALAHEAMLLIRRQIRCGMPAEAVVAEVIELTFGASNDCMLDRTPHAVDPRGDRLPQLLRDDAERRRIVAEVLAIVAESEAEQAVPVRQ